MYKTKEARNAAQRKWAKENPEKIRAMGKSWALRNPERIRLSHVQRTYGISELEYATLWMVQCGKCAICTEPMETGNIHVDHDHETNRVRGLLCSNCNRAIGLFGDDLTVVLAAGDYLGESNGVR